MARVRVICPHAECRASYEIEEAQLGKRGRCKRCGTAFVLVRSEPQPSTVVWAPGQVVFGDFEVERLLGQGGMGAVHLVRSRGGLERFAVKTILPGRLGDETSRRNFIAELRTWTDLPAHPHLVACRFFRTVGDQVAIFAEYVEGGSLSQWIRGRKLTRLGEILDVAIQIAWGLHAGHEFGLVHQDVKPGNVLMTPDGVAKVSDFGLARARTAASSSAGGPQQTTQVAWAGMTPAYCSPEQAAGRPLSRRSDVWNWGVSVMELFAGETRWLVGSAANEVLDDLLQSGAPDPRLPAIPEGVADVLRTCFERDPGRRWSWLAEAAEELQKVYRQLSGTTYPRSMPATPDRESAGAVEHDRRTVRGFSWSDPARRLRKALREAGRPVTEAASFLPGRAGSRRAQAIADLGALETARGILERLIADGRRDLEPELAELCMDKALVHQALDDGPACLPLYDRALALYEQQLTKDPSAESRSRLAGACMMKASALFDVRDARAALPFYDRAIEQLAQLVEEEGRQELRSRLAGARLNKASTLLSLGELQAAGQHYDLVIPVYEELIERDKRRDLRGFLAAACYNKALTLKKLDEYDAALAMYDRAITLYEQLVEQEGRQELRGPLASAYHNKANVLHALEDFAASATLYDRVIALYEVLVEAEGRSEFSPSLALTCTGKGIVLVEMGEVRAAVELYDRAIAQYSRLVEQQGRLEFRGDLAQVRLHRVKALAQFKERRAVASEARAAVAMLRAEVERTGRPDWKDTLDNATEELADIL